MNKITFENLPSTNTPINATNLNQLQTNVEDAINAVDEDLQELSTEKYVDANTTGWYRLAKITGTGHPANTAILSISTNYSNTPSCSILTSIITAWTHAKMAQLVAVDSSTTKAISKIRIQYDSTGQFFYVDAYYNVSTSNRIYVRNENILKTNVEILTPAKVTTEYTTLQELTISY